MRLTVASLIVGLSLVVVPVRSVSACDPAPNHSLEIISDDSPACAVISNGSDYEGAVLNVDNQCSEVFTLRGDACEGCDSSVSVSPGEQGAFYVERREQASSPSLVWETGEDSGQVSVETTWANNTGACDRLGCQVSPPNRGVPWLLGLGLLVVGGFVRRRSSARA